MARNVNGSSVENYLRLMLDADGNRTVAVSNAAAWRSGLGVPPTSHADSATTYGVGTTSNYGHVKFVDGLLTRTATDPGTGAGLAASAHQLWYAMQEAFKATYNSGWKSFPFASGFANYGTNNGLRYRRRGNTVELIGVCKNTSNIESGGSATIGTLPTGYRPNQNVYVVCQGSGAAKWLCTIDNGGNVQFARYGTDSYSVAEVDRWLPIQTTFLTTDAIPS